MDSFDKASVAALVVLGLASSVVIMGHRSEVKPDQNKVQRLAAQEDPAARMELDNAGKLIRNLLEAGSLSQAEALIGELIRKHPYQGAPHMFMGDLLMRKQDPVRAMYAYQQAIDLNPDYLDKKTPLFQGKKLKVAVGEALTEIESRIRKDPGNGSLKGEKKVIYYFYRRIAGSCG
jgi:cytochrome c-type biogenesis protein CcmH/NrfG